MTVCRKGNKSLRNDGNNQVADAIVLVFLLYFVGVFDFLRSQILLTLLFYALLLLCSVSFIFYIYKRKRLTQIDILVSIYALFFPVICAIQSNRVFEQPVYLGLVSMRYGLLIFWGYFLCIADYDYNRLISRINSINIIVALVSIVLLLVFGIDGVKMQDFTISTNSIDIEYMDDLVKGKKLTVCSSMMIVSYVFYLLKFLKRPSLSKDTAVLVILMFYLLFVHKGRQPLAAIGMVYVIYLLSLIFKLLKSVFVKGRIIVTVRVRNMFRKILFLSAFPVLLLVFLIVSKSSMLSSFSAILDLTDSVDGSTLARLESIDSVLPYIQKYYLFGFGNLSSHFLDNGFQYFFGKYFYLADIGIVAVLAQGGIFLLLLYFLLYRAVYRKSSLLRNSFLRDYSKYMVMSFVLMLFLLTDVLFADNCIIFSSVFFPLFGTGNPNLHIKS